jgi:hypothetical protein
MKIPLYYWLIIPSILIAVYYFSFQPQEGFQDASSEHFPNVTSKYPENYASNGRLSSIHQYINDFLNESRSQMETETDPSLQTALSKSLTYLEELTKHMETLTDPNSESKVKDKELDDMHNNIQLMKNYLYNKHKEGTASVLSANIKVVASQVKTIYDVTQKFLETEVTDDINVYKDGILKRSIEKLETLKKQMKDEIDRGALTGDTSTNITSAMLEDVHKTIMHIKEPDKYQ